MRDEPLIEAVEKWGKPIQLIMCIEEMAELTKEISKYFRGRDNYDQLLEETADVYIMLEQLKIMFNFSAKEIGDVIETKIKKLEKRLIEDS
jgi:hypothetical protein